MELNTDNMMTAGNSSIVEMTPDTEKQGEYIDSQGKHNEIQGDGNGNKLTNDADSFEKFIQDRLGGQKIGKGEAAPAEEEADAEEDAVDDDQAPEAEADSLTDRQRIEADLRKEWEAEQTEKLQSLEWEKNLLKRKDGDIWAGYPEDLKQTFEESWVPKVSEWGGEVLTNLAGDMRGIMVNAGLGDFISKAQKGDLFLDEADNARFVASMDQMVNHLLTELPRHHLGVMTKGIQHFMTNAMEESYYQAQSAQEDQKLVTDRVDTLKGAFTDQALSLKVFDQEIVKDAWDDFVEASNKDFTADPNELARKFLTKYSKYIKKGAQEVQKVREQNDRLAPSKSRKPAASAPKAKNLEDFIQSRFGR